RQLSGSAALPASGAVLLGERARLMGLQRRGAISPNGSCRLIQTRDGFVALNLPREDDWDLVSAMVQAPVQDWGALVAILYAWRRDALIERGRLLGLAIAADRPAGQMALPFRAERLGAARPRHGAPLV